MTVTPLQHIDIVKTNPSVWTVYKVIHVTVQAQDTLDLSVMKVSSVIRVISG